ncbi:MAG: alpha-ketoacid dehydrogenase subunit beta, partial [Pseudomonadales bacterium]
MSEAVKAEPRVIPYVSAINEGVRQVLLEQEDAFVAGEDVAGAGGVYGYYTGLLQEFGPERVYDTPISEKGIIGLGVGASATGCRPVVDLMFMDFIGECMDEIANQMA